MDRVLYRIWRYWSTDNISIAPLPLRVCCFLSYFTLFRSSAEGISKILRHIFYNNLFTIVKKLLYFLTSLYAWIRGWSVRIYDKIEAQKEKTTTRCSVINDTGATFAFWGVFY